MANRIVSKRLVGISKQSPLHGRFGRLPLWQQRMIVRVVLAGAKFANRILPGYTSPNDAGKYELIVDHDMPASYVNSGTFITSGDQINASDFGLGGFEAVGVDSLINGTSVPGGPFPSIVAEVALGGSVAGSGVAGLTLGATAVASAVLHYFQSPTRATEFANTTNLSSAFVRLRIMAV